MGVLFIVIVVWIVYVFKKYIEIDSFLLVSYVEAGFVLYVSVGVIRLMSMFISILMLMLVLML